MKDILDRSNFVFLDLEETCIDDWTTGVLLEKNLAKIEEFLNGRDRVIAPFKKNQEPIVSKATPIINLRLGLMSWAVWNDADVREFNELLRAPIEAAIKRKFDEDLIWSMKDWAKAIAESSNKVLLENDMFDLYGKPEVLFSLMRNHPMFDQSTIFLIDDAYEHQLTLKSYVRHVTVEFQNINEM